MITPAPPSNRTSAPTPEVLRWVCTLFVCGLSGRSAAAMVGIRHLCDQVGEDRVTLRILDIQTDDRAALKAGVVAIPGLLAEPLPSLESSEPQANAGDAAAGRIECLEAELDQLQTLLQLITGGTADALLLGGDEASGDATLFTPNSANDPYRFFVEQMPEGAATLSASGLLLYANQQLADLLGRPREALLGRPLTDWVPVTQHPLLEQLARVTPGRSDRAAFHLLRPDASPVHVLGAVRGLDSDGAATLSLIVTDLSSLPSNAELPPGSACLADHR